jgi:hypothetical protein
VIGHLSLEDVWASRQRTDSRDNKITVCLTDKDRGRLEAQAGRLRNRGRTAFAATLASELIARGLDALEAEG